MSSPRGGAQERGPRWRHGLSELLADQSDDLWGLGFLVVALLVGLGVYVDVIGPAGRALRSASADVFGIVRFFVPLAFATLGCYLLLRHERSQPGRVAVGLGLALLSLSGLADIAFAPSSLHIGLRAMGRAGGALGALEGVPLRAALAGWGAGLVLLTLLFVSVLIITATPVRVVAGGARRGLLVCGRGLVWARDRAGDALHGGEKMDAAARHPSVRGPGTARRSSLRARRPPPPSGPLAEAGEAEMARLAEAQRVRRGGSSAGEFAWAGLAAETGVATTPGDGDDGSSGPRPGAAARKSDAGVGSASDQPDGAPPDGGAIEAAGLGVSRAEIAISGLAASTKGEQLAIDLPVPRQAAPWRLPPMPLLRRSKQAEVDRTQVEILGQTLEGALAAHGVETRVVGATVGPSVTRYELELGPGVKVQRVLALQKDIAYAMAAAEVRILAPIPGRSAIGVEVPNRQRQVVTLGDILSSPEAAAARHPLEVAAGRDIYGRPVLVNLAEMPHLLIAGATGSGKSSCINSMLTSVLMRATPDQVRLILVDPKRVELGAYSGLPHLLTAVVTNPKKAANALQWAVREMERRYDLLAEAGMRDITGYNAAYDRGDFRELNEELARSAGFSAGGPYTGPTRAEAAGAASVGSASRTNEYGSDVDDMGDSADWPGEVQLSGPSALGAAVREITGPRAGAFEAGADGLGPDQSAVDRLGLAPGGAPEGSDQTRPLLVGDIPERYSRLPFILVVVDELNDLMMVAARDVEESICRIAQMARAVGIHLVLATQRPSVDVITGLIKANVPSRMAFAVSSLADSRVVLDQPGAERLIGKGDMLMVTASSSLAQRLQGPWVDEEDVRKVVAHWRRQSGPSYVEGVEGADAPGGAGSAGDPGDDDDLLEEAMELVVRSQLGSTSMLQRKLRVGFARAGRLMDLLEQRGVVGPSEGSKARAVLMTVEELEERGR
ncbi:MAG TPA: DNA translocase FtsK [Acidimicrobiales bacterium]|nr:DNA translocase FtsK [Acidimicrobiales bacterium]